MTIRPHFLGLNQAVTEADYPICQAGGPFVNANYFAGGYPQAHAA
jgi:hypothetical protein